MNHLYEVEMSEPGCVFMVVAKNEGEAACKANAKWREFDYYFEVKAIKVSLAGFNGQYPPKSSALSSDIPWFIED